MSLHLITPRTRGFICANAHPAGCAQNVMDQIESVRKKLGPGRTPLNVLVVGASTGYGLASRIAVAFGLQAKTIGVFFEREPNCEKTATAGYYNSVEFHRQAKKVGLYARSFNGDAFADETKKAVFQQIRKDLGSIDYVIYSLASPRRIHPKTGKTDYSAIKPIGSSYPSKSVDLNSGLVHNVTIEPATEEEISGTQSVMGGEDWSFWIEGLIAEKLLNSGARTVAYSYIGPQQTSPVYRDGTIGRAKDHLEKTAQDLNALLQEKLKGNAWVSINKAVVTQASAAIPVVPLYLAVLYRLMKQKGIHEDCIEQMARLFSDSIGPGKSPALDSKGRIRLDDLEMRDDVQSEITRIWRSLVADQKLAEFESYKKDFQRLFGFEVDSVDYSIPVETEIRLDNDSLVPLAHP